MDLRSGACRCSQGRFVHVRHPQRDYEASFGGARARPCTTAPVCTIKCVWGPLFGKAGGARKPGPAALSHRLSRADINATNGRPGLPSGEVRYPPDSVAKLGIFEERFL